MPGVVLSALSTYLHLIIIHILEVRNLMIREFNNFLKKTQVQIYLDSKPLPLIFILASPNLYTELTSLTLPLCS